MTEIKCIVDGCNGKTKRIYGFTEDKKVITEEYMIKGLTFAPYLYACMDHICIASRIIELYKGCIICPNMYRLSDEVVYSDLGYNDMLDARTRCGVKNHLIGADVMPTCPKKRITCAHDIKCVARYKDFFLQSECKQMDVDPTEPVKMTFDFKHPITMWWLVEYDG